MPSNDDFASAIAAAQNRADEILAKRKIARDRRAVVLAEYLKTAKSDAQIIDAVSSVGSSGVKTVGFLVAAGDSWFDYPRHDVIKLLEDNHGYNVESAAHRGDPIEAMAYQGGQLDKFARGLEKIVAQGGTPKAALLSGGGNDIAGNEFGMLLNNATSAIGGWNSNIVAGVLERILAAFRSMIISINRICQQDIGRTIPILVHGYDYPVPDGRGFWGGWPFPGPWLEPGFREKLFKDLQATTLLMRDIISKFNTMLGEVSKDSLCSNVHYVNLLGTLSSDLIKDDYKKSWENELHPNEQGFAKIAAKFAEVLDAL